MQYIEEMTNAYERWDGDDALRWRSYVTDILGETAGQEAAELMEVSPSTITNWKRLGKRPSLELLERFAEAFGRPLEEVRMHAGLSPAPISTAMLDSAAIDAISQKVADKLLRELGDDHPLLLAIKERRRTSNGVAKIRPAPTVRKDIRAELDAHAKAPWLEKPSV